MCKYYRAWPKVLYGVLVRRTLTEHSVLGLLLVEGRRARGGGLKKWTREVPITRALMDLTGTGG